jgi:hypothetical protein
MGNEGEKIKIEHGTRKRKGRGEVVVSFRAMLHGRAMSCDNLTNP